MASDWATYIRVIGFFVGLCVFIVSAANLAIHGCIAQEFKGMSRARQAYLLFMCPALPLWLFISREFFQERP